MTAGRRGRWGIRRSHCGRGRLCSNIAARECCAHCPWCRRRTGTKGVGGCRKGDGVDGRGALVEKRKEKRWLNVYSGIVCDLDEKLSHGANSELVYRRDCPTTPSEL